MKNIIVNIIVIGFHHKRGCEIEFIYPSLNENNSSSIIQDQWKNLTSLALPDGAHKCDSDIFNFILPNDDNSNNKILFGISCFKQISSNNLKNKSDEITRNSVQKSVVVLSTHPLFNSIGSLLHGITENYFETGDFLERNILIESFYQLNEHFRLIFEDNAMKHNNYPDSLIDIGLSVSDLILRYEFNIFVLIKLIILRKKLVFSMEPISKLTSTILCLVSLFSGEFTSSKLQNIMKYVDDDTNENITENISNLEVNESTSFNDESDFTANEFNKSQNNENKISTGTSLFQNIKSGGGQAIKVFSNFAVSTLIRSSEPDITPKQTQIDDTSAPLPPFIDKIGYVRDNELNDYRTRDSWGFPLGIFDEKNILLPYASLGFLNVLDNKKINSFIIGASNHLWKMKSAKIDVIINEDNKNGGIEYCSKELQNGNKKNEESLFKLVQLTTLDRRLGDYLLQVVKIHNSSMIKCNSSSNITNTLQLKNDDIDNNITTVDMAEDVLAIKTHDFTPDHKFIDHKSLDEWLRQVITDYIRAILLSAAGWGTRQSFLDFGPDFMLAVQQLDYFEDWYYSMDKELVVKESRYSITSLTKSESTLSLNVSNSREESELENHKKTNNVMNYDHPGKFIPGRLGDNIPGYYQMKEYADQSKALMNRSVNEIKRIGSEKGGKLKLSVSAGLSKLSGIAKVHSSKMTSTWWHTETKTDQSDETTRIKE